MANTVSILNYANTFGDWIIATNSLAKENNDLAANNYHKTSGTLYLDTSSLALQANGNANFGSQLSVQGIGSSLYVQTNANFGSQVYFSNSALTLTANGLVLINGVGTGIVVANTANVGGNFNVTGATSLANTLNVTSATSLSNTLNVTGATSLANTLNVTGATTLIGAASLSNTLNVTGATSLANTLNVTGATTLIGATSLANTLNVTGATSLANTLNVTGATSLANTLNVTGATSLANTLKVTGATSLVNTLNVTGATSLANTLNVTGATSLANTLNVTGATSLANTLNVTGATTLIGTTSLANTLNVTGATSLANTLNVTGATTLTNVNLNILQANTSVNTPLLGVSNVGYINNIQANTSVNTNIITAYSGAMTNLQVLNQLTVAGNFVLTGTTVYTSNTFTLSQGTSTGIISAYTVSRGNTSTAASIRWNEPNTYWDIVNVNSNVYSQILTSSMLSNSIASTSNSTIATSFVANTLNGIISSETSRATAAEALLAPLASPTFTGTVSGITKAMVGLGSIDNTTDLLKPVSTATTTAIGVETTRATAAEALKAPLVSPNLSGLPTAPTAVSTDNSTLLATTAYVTNRINSLINAAPAALDTLGEIATQLAADESAAAALTTAVSLKAPLASPTFTGTVSGITKAMVGLGSVDNTTDLLKPVSTATTTAIGVETTRATAAEALLAPLASPTFTGTVSGITKAMVGLGSVDNTADAAKPVSTATATAIGVETSRATAAEALKAPLASPTFTGTVTAPTFSGALSGNATNITGTYAGAITSSQVTTGLSYTPVQQGTGVGQLGNLVKIGWSGSGLKVTVDVSDLGVFLLSSNYNGYSPTLTGTGASGTWSIDISGNAATATNITAYTINQSVGSGNDVQHNSLGLGTTAPGSGALYATGNITAYSDQRLKENVNIIPNSLEKVKSLRGVTFTRNDKEDTNKLYTGVIAQEVLAVLPEAVFENCNGMYSVDYGNMVGLLIEAIKDLAKEIDILKQNNL